MSLLDRAPFTALGLVWPAAAPSQPPGPADVGAGSRRFRLVASNALKSNPRPDAYARALCGLGADVLCVAELTPAIDAAVRAAGAPAHSCREVAAGSAGTGLWSRWPLEDARVLRAGHALAVAFVPALGVTVGAVHTMAPSRRWRERVWWRSFAAIESVAASSAADGPVVLAGDWNATMAHGPLRRLVAGGRLRDAHVDAGRASARTWPARVPVALLDRVLVSAAVAVTSIREVRLPGSDHRAVVADLVVPPPFFGS